MNLKKKKQPFWQGAMFTLIGYNYFYYAILSIFISYLPIYFKSQGISPTQIGLLLGIGPFVSIMSPPLWGFLSDKFKTVKKILLIILVMVVWLGTLLFRSNQFEIMFLFVILYNFFMSPIGPLTDGLTYRITEQHNVNFGSVRLFGSIGFATTALLMGIVFDQYGLSVISWVYLGYGMIAILACWKLQDAPASTKPVSLHSMLTLFKNKKIMWFLFVVLIISIPHRINDGFLGVYIDSLGGTTGQVGQAWFLATGSEALMIGLSIRWLRNHQELKLIAVAAVFYCIRWFLCAILDDADWITYLQMFHGITFAIYYLAAMQYVYKIVPEEMKATGQTVFAAVFFGVAGIVGSLIAGWFFEVFGGSSLYGFMTGLSFLGFVLVFYTMVRQGLIGEN